MGRKKIKTEEKKIRMSITIDPNIEKIIRQGDCILIKPKNIELVTDNSPVRHLTEEEYKYLLVAES
jgi:hypothetical protein